MAKPNPFDYITSSAARRVPGLPGQAWADPNSPIARMAAGKPATDNPLMQMLGKNRMNPVNDRWTGKDSPIGRAMNWHSEVVNDALKGALTPYSTAKQGLVPTDLLRGTNVAAGVAAWGSKGASIAGLPVSVTARPLALGEGTAQAVRAAMIGLPARPKGPVWEAMMGKQLTAAMAPFGAAADMARNVSAMTQGSGLQSVMGRVSSQAFPPGWASLVKIKPALVPLSNLGAAATDYAAAARRIHETLGVEETVEGDAEFRPTVDDTAYQALTALAPDVAALVDEQADGIITYFWPRHFVRNSLAVAAFAVVEALYVYVLVLLPLFISPSMEQAELSAGTYGLHALEGFGMSTKAYRRIAPSQEDPTND